tara:strand:- start:156 stop:851 length:696 start_codon:yes stop_codon:yes gene_type:complete
MSDVVDKKIRQAIFHLLKEQRRKPDSYDAQGIDPFDVTDTNTFKDKDGKPSSPFSTKPEKEKKKQTKSSEEDSKDKKSQKPKPKEQKNNKGIISTAGAFGSGGRAKAFVASAGARAQTDPKGLLEDLGVKSPDGGTDLEVAHSIISAAIYANIVMGEAYSGARLTRDSLSTSSDKKERDVVAVKMGELDRKNGVRFLAHTLIAAQNAGMLNLSDGLQFAEGQSNPIIIYSI